MGINSLLSEVGYISKKYDEIYKNTGGYFNIFSIANIGYDEITICRVIKELIDPKGSHYQGAAYLKLFMECVLKQDFDIEELEHAVVEREKLIVGNKRIDLYIKIPGKASIPIEVKIYAGDQPSQCCDYFRYAYNSKLYYLTLDGHMPSEKSLAALDPKNVKSISFKKEILEWLTECLKLPETVRMAPIREVLLQFVEILRNLTNKSEGKMENEVLKLIMESKENFKNAEIIMNAVKEAECKMYDWYFKALDKRICEKYPELNIWTEELDEEYDRNGIFYPVRTLKEGHMLCLEIACDSLMYAGFTICDSNEVDIEWKDYISQEELITGKWQSTDILIAWKYISCDVEECPDFRNHNEAFYNLLNQNEFEQFIEESMKTIEELMGSLN